MKDGFPGLCALVPEPHKYASTRTITLVSLLAIVVHLPISPKDLEEPAQKSNAGVRVPLLKRNTNSFSPEKDY